MKVSRHRLMLVQVSGWQVANFNPSRLQSVRHVLTVVTLGVHLAKWNPMGRFSPIQMCITADCTYLLNSYHGSQDQPGARHALSFIKSVHLGSDCKNTPRHVALAPSVCQYLYIQQILSCLAPSCKRLLVSAFCVQLISNYGCRNLSSPSSGIQSFRM